VNGRLIAPAPTWPATCGACIEASDCCGAAEACAEDPACRAFVDCVADDHGPHAALRCGHDIPLASAYWPALRGCLEESCRLECLSANWSCNEDYDWPEPVSAGGIVSLHTIAAEEGYIPDGVARACDGPSCAAVIAEAASDEGVGIVYLDVPFTFEGYFELDTDVFYPLRLYTPPVWRDRDVTTLALSIETFASLAADVGEPIEPGMGRLVLLGHDCIDGAASGVSVTLSSNGITDPPKAYYVGDNGPLVGATETTAEGLVLWLNVPPGTVTYTGTVVQTGETVFLSSVQVDADAHTFVYAYPKTKP